MKYAIGYKVSVFCYGDKTTFEYVGGGEWKFISGYNTAAMYQQLMDLVG